MKRTVHFLVVLLLPCLAFAQPPERHGCLILPGGQRPAPVSLTAQQKAQIDETIARSDTFDIIHYNITLDVTDYTGGTLAGSCTVTFQPLMAGQTFIRFDLLDLTVDSVTDAGGTLAFTHDGAFLRVDFAAPPPVGVDQQLTVHYHGNPYQDPVWGGVYFASNIIYNLGIGLSTIPPNFGKALYPCFDSFVERATYSWGVKSAGGRRLHGQGDLTAEVFLGGDTVMRFFEMNDAIPTHVSAFAVGNYADSNWVHTGAYGPVPVRLTALSSGINTMVNKFAGLNDAIDALEFWYGPQPYGRVGYIQTTDGAMEHPTNIAYPIFMNSQPDQDNQDLYSHELGHYWWGDKATPHVHNHMWLKEGPAEYSGHLVEEWRDGHAAFINIVKGNHLNVLRNAHLSDGGFQALSPMPDAHIYGDHTYYKGASVMHNLRGYLGDSLFRQAMTGAQTLLAESDVLPGQFRDALEAASGYDLDAFFNDQVFNPGFSVWVTDAFTSVYDANTSAYDVDVDLRQRLRACPDHYTQVPLDLTLIGNNWERKEYRVTASGETDSYWLEDCPFIPYMVVLNGGMKLNQARMDHEFVIRPGVAFAAQLPWVDFRLDDLVVPDSALVRVEHIWAGPEANNLGAGIGDVSDTHYWRIDGIWPAGLKLDGRVIYDGSGPNDIDFDLYSNTEENAVLAWRATPLDPWTPYPYATITAGNLFNGSGTVDIDTLMKGEYAFANNANVVGVQEQAEGADEVGGQVILVFPTPANETITVSLDAAAHRTLFIDLLDAEGRRVQRTQAAANGTFSRRLDVSALSTGTYTLRVSAMDGRVIGTGRCVVE